MLRYHSVLAALAVSVVLGLFSATVAFAYIPPAQFIVKSIAHKHSGYKKIQVKTQVIKMEGGQPTAIHFTEQTVYYPASGVLKSWAMDDQGHHLYEVERKAKEISPASAILFDSRVFQLTEMLKAKGVLIPTEGELKALPTEDDRRAAERSALVRWNHLVAWVVGNAAPQSEISRGRFSTPQLWVEKDTFLPVRLIAALQNGESDITDISMENYRISKEFPYPRIVTWSKGKDPYFKSELSDLSIDAGADLGKDLNPSLGGWTEAGNTSGTALRELISTYYAVLR